MTDGVCPVCNGSLQSRSWSDEVWGACYVVETLQQCPLGHYQFHVSYGLAEVLVNGKEFGWHYSDSDEFVEDVKKQILEAAKGEGGKNGS